MRQISLKAIALGLGVGLVMAVAGLLALIVAVAAGSGVDITDVRNAALAHRASVQLPFLSVWLLALLASGMTAGRVLRGRALGLHGGVIGGIALLGALAGVSREDPAWAIALQLLLTVPVVIAGVYVRPLPDEPPAALPMRWALVLALLAFSAATIALAASEDAGVIAWTAFVATGALLAAAVGRRFRGNA
jgi:hypothetical protein